MKEKRYEIYKRGELENRNPPGVNALGGGESGADGDILSNRSRFESPLPRSSLNNDMYNALMNKKALRRRPFGNPQGSAAGAPQKREKKP